MRVTLGVRGEAVPEDGDVDMDSVGPEKEVLPVPLCATERVIDRDDVWVAVRVQVGDLDKWGLWVEVEDKEEQERDGEKVWVGVRLSLRLSFRLGEKELERLRVGWDSVGVRVMLEMVPGELLGVTVRAESDSVALGLEESVGVGDAEMLVWPTERGRDGDRASGR